MTIIMSSFIYYSSSRSKK